MCDQQRLRPACAYAQTDQSLCWSLKYSITVRLLTEPHSEFLGLKGGCAGSSESTLVKIPHCWKSHVRAKMLYKCSSYCYCNIYGFTVWMKNCRYWSAGFILTFTVFQKMYKILKSFCAFMHCALFKAYKVFSLELV